MIGKLIIFILIFISIIKIKNYIIDQYNETMVNSWDRLNLLHTVMYRRHIISYDNDIYYPKNKEEQQIYDQYEKMSWNDLVRQEKILINS